MTLAFVTLELYPTTVGGAGILLYHTISALLRKEYRVILYLDLAEEEIRQFEQRDRHGYPNPHLLTFYDVRTMSRALEFCAGMYDDSEQFRSVSMAHAILRTQDEQDIDLIEFYDYCGPAYHYLSYPPARRRPVAIRFHNTTEIIERGTRSAFNSRRLYTFAMERAQLTMADLVLSPGQTFLDEEIRPLYRLELTRQQVMIAPPIHTSIGSVTYNPASRRILFYGRLSTFKGLDTFITAAVIAMRDTEFRNWLSSFVIVGPEETVASALTLDEMKSVIPAELADRFVFVGRVTHKQLMQILGDVAFACFANRMESFCYAAHELHTAGIPLILSDRPAFRDHFTDEDVIFFGRTASGLAREMTALAADQAKRSTMAEHALATPEMHDADMYLEFAACAGKRLAARFRPDVVVEGAPLLTVFVLSNGDAVAEGRTIASLDDDRVIIFVMRLADDGGLTYAGLRWTPLQAGDLLGSVTDAYMFVRAGDVCVLNVLLDAARTLIEDEQIGAIAPWCDIDGRVRAAVHAYVPEFAATLGPGLRTLIRADNGTTVIELLRTSSVADEMSALLAQRADARALVEHPAIGVSIDGSVYIPPQPHEPDIDFDRMTPMVLALSRGLPVSSGTGARCSEHRPRPRPLSGHDLISIRATTAFGDGETWILRVFSQRGALNESWSSVYQIGEWMLIQEPHSPPGGALKTHTGELCFWADHRYGVEFLFGPFCSGVEIRWRDQVFMLKLRHDVVLSTVVWLDELARGLFLPPQSGRAPLREIGQTILNESTAAWIREHIGAETSGMILTRAPDRSAPSEVPTISLGEFMGFPHFTPGDAAFGLLAAAQGKQSFTIQLPFDWPESPLIAGLLLRSDHIRLSVDLDEKVSDSPAQALYRALASWAGLAEGYGERLIAKGANDDLLFPLEQAGAKIVRRRCTLPVCQILQTHVADEIDLVILGSDGLIENVAHMVAAASLLRDHGIVVSTLFLEAGHHHAVLICEALAAARSYISYTTLERVVALPRKRALIGCAVYPDPFIPLPALKALSLGVPVLVGPVGSSSAYADALNNMSVPFWEDSRDIAEALSRFFKHRDKIMQNYNKVAAELLLT